MPSPYNPSKCLNPTFWWCQYYILNPLSIIYDDLRFTYDDLTVTYDGDEVVNC